MIGLLVQILGLLMILAALLDVFLTVLYARIGTGVIMPYLAPGMWRMFRSVARVVPPFKQKILSFCAPVLLVTMIVMWVGMLIVGTALIVWPKLGISITAARGDTPRDFATA